MSNLFSILVAISILGSSVTGYSISDFNGSLRGFGQNIFSEIFSTSGDRNTIISPFSIQTCLTMLRMGADGETAKLLDQALGFTGLTPETVAENYQTMLAKYEDCDIVKMANKIYVREGYALQDNYRNLLNTKFYSIPEEIDFAQANTAAETMNSWVESKTNHTIRGIIEADNLGSDTRLVLVSAINFDGKWENPFLEEDTKEADFFVSPNQTVKVQMMKHEGEIQFVQSKELPFIGVKLPYKDSDLSMLILLPHHSEVFTDFQSKLSQIPLETLKEQMFKIDGHVLLPKFKAEFEIDLKDTLKKVNITLCVHKSVS